MTTADELTTQFETFQGELKSFILRMTASVQDAEDILQGRIDLENMGLQHCIESRQGSAEIEKTLA